MRRTLMFIFTCLLHYILTHALTYFHLIADLVILFHILINYIVISY